MQQKIVKKTDENLYIVLFLPYLGPKTAQKYQKDSMKTMGAYSSWKKVDRQTDRHTDDGRLGIGYALLTMSAGELTIFIYGHVDTGDRNMHAYKGRLFHLQRYTCKA